jgi:signal transduction histidine kinase
MVDNHQHSRKRRPNAFSDERERLELMNRRKDEFLGTLAHELRNPLASLRFGLEILNQADADPASKERARRILDRQIDQLVRIVDDLRDITRIAQGKVEVRKSTLELASLVIAAVDLCRPAADAAAHSLTVSLPGRDVAIHGDSARLTQVLVNLLNNAIKFTPPGGHISVIAEESSGRRAVNTAVRIRVRDTGVGIAPGMKQKIFEMFVQDEQAAAEHGNDGMGVGLNVVQRLVALHGGAVDVRSDGVGRGSEFIVTLPTSASRRRARTP